MNEFRQGEEYIDAGVRNPEDLWMEPISEPEKRFLVKKLTELVTLPKVENASHPIGYVNILIGKALALVGDRNENTSRGALELRRFRPSNHLDDPIYRRIIQYSKPATVLEEAIIEWVWDGNEYNSEKILDLYLDSESENKNRELIEPWIVDLIRAPIKLSGSRKDNDVTVHTPAFEIDPEEIVELGIIEAVLKIGLDPSIQRLMRRQDSEARQIIGEYMKSKVAELSRVYEDKFTKTESVMRNKGDVVNAYFEPMMSALGGVGFDQNEASEIMSDWLNLSNEKEEE